MCSMAVGGMSAPTSIKQRNFVGEPMGLKPVYALPGIGQTLGGRLIQNGINNADQVMGKFLTLNKDEGLFQAWLKENCHCNSKQAGDCYMGLQTYWVLHF